MQEPIIEFENFTFKYKHQAKPTLNGINLTIYKGEKVLIVGPSGSGKSTLGQCLNGLIPFSYEGDITGSLKIKGTETRSLDLFSISKLVGTVLQDSDSQFLGLTVAEDIAFSLENQCVPKRELLEKVRQAARLVEMEDKLEASVHALSGGQKQRTALGGVMVDDVEILLFDEPLAALDPHTGKYAIELIDQIQKETDTTVIIIEHRLEDVLHKSVDRIVVVNNGLIQADLKPDTLLASDLLATHHIREPLYLKALKYAGSNIEAHLLPSHLDTMDLTDAKASIQKWLATPVPKGTEQNHPEILKITNLDFTYPNGVKALNDINVTIKKGEMISIVGKNGAGKSTFAQILGGLNKDYVGILAYNGQDMRSQTITQHASKIGLVMQNPNHMISKHLIMDEVALGLRHSALTDSEIQAKVENALKVCGLFPFRNWPVSALSYGQKKRVTIASILVLEPEVLILDEPTAGQDLRSYTEIMEFLEQLNQQGMTVILITHDMHLMLEYTTRALVFEGGELIADRRPEAVLSDKELSQRAYLKETSLQQLAHRLELDQNEAFIRHFIDYDKEVRKTW